MKNVNLEGYRKNMTKKEFIENVVDEGDCTIRYGLPNYCEECDGDCDVCWEKALVNIEFKSETVIEREEDVKSAVEWAMEQIKEEKEKLNIHKRSEEDIRPFIPLTIFAPKEDSLIYKELVKYINDRNFEEAKLCLEELM